MVEEHFRRSLGKNYKEPEPAPNSVSITGSVDDHFAKALGDTWLQIKAAKDSASSSPESASRRGQPASPTAHMGSQHGNRNSTEHRSSGASLLPALVTKETSAGLPPGSRDPAALS